MKKVILCFMLIASTLFVGCSNQSQAKAKDGPIFKVKSKIGNEEKTLEYFRDKKIKFVEDDVYNFNIYFDGMSYNEQEEIIELEFENNNENLSAVVRLEGLKVNDYTINSDLCSKVLNKSKAKDRLIILKDELKFNGLETGSKKNWNIEQFNITLEVELENIGFKKYNFIVYPIKENFLK